MPVSKVVRIVSATMFPSNLCKLGERMRFQFLVAKLSRLIFALSFTVIVSGINTSVLVQAQDKNSFSLFKFELLTTNSGWVLLDQHLFWTSDRGQTWHEIGPSIPSYALIQDVEFKDANTGWVLWTS